MHYLFYGENTFLVHEKVLFWKKKFFSNDSTGLNYLEIEGENLTKELFSSVAFSLPFLGPKRLIIVKNFLLSKADETLKKDIVSDLTKVPESTIIVFAEYGLPDARKSNFKTLNKPKISQKFDKLSGAKLMDWIDSKSREFSGSAFSPKQKIKLELFTSGDLWRLNNEIKKLCLYAQHENKDISAITDPEFESLVASDVNASIFNFIDYIASKNLKKSFESLRDLIDSGENELYILTMIVYQFRSMLIVDELKNCHITSKEISSKSKIHPFVVGKILSNLQKFQSGSLEKYYDLLQKTDAEIKKGIIEPNLGLTLLVEKLCR